MSYIEAMALAGQLPSWELRAAVYQARDLAKNTCGHEAAFALAAQVVLTWRRSQDAS
jgi:hypothetical protein